MNREIGPVTVELAGCRMTLVKAAASLNMSYATLRGRIRVLGWSMEKVMNTPVRPIRRRCPRTLR